jgi:hypothetical protein
MHISYGYCKHESDEDERCFHCDAAAGEFAYTYFGAPICKTCWDNWWLKTEDGQCDPTYDNINHRVSGEWLDIG